MGAQDPKRLLCRLRGEWRGSREGIGAVALAWHEQSVGSWLYKVARTEDSIRWLVSRLTPYQRCRPEDHA